MANKVVTWWDRNRPLRVFSRPLTYGQFTVVPERLVTSDFINRFGAYVTVQDQDTGDFNFIGDSVPERPTYDEQPIYGAPSFITNPSISSAMPDVEWQIPNSPSVLGKVWPRVTATQYASPGGWAFAYRTNNRIRATFYNNVLVGTAPNRKPSAYTSDILIDQTNTQFIHDEPDISWHPSAENVTVAWNVRTSSPNAVDIRYRVLTDTGTFITATDAIATHTTYGNQKRPILEPLVYGASPAVSPESMLLSFGGDLVDTAYFTVLPNTSPYNLPSPPGEDVQMALIAGFQRQSDQHAIELPNGHIFCAWTHVEGKSKVRWRTFNPQFEGATSPTYNELPLQLQFGKAEPRVRYHNNKIWLVYHEEWAGGQYNGVNVWATVFNYVGSPFSITVHKPEFCVHPINFNGLQRKPEVVLWGDRALVVFEHYPRGIINTLTPPSYTGGSVIAGRLFDLGGTVITPVTRISTTTSLTGNWRFMLRPDVEKSTDNSRAIVCWTASTASDGDISATGSNAKIWARVIDLTALP